MENLQMLQGYRSADNLQWTYEDLPLLPRHRIWEKEKAMGWDFLMFYPICRKMNKKCDNRIPVLSQHSGILHLDFCCKEFAEINGFTVKPCDNIGVNHDE
jgi:hypothetical protein